MLETKNYAEDQKIILETRRLRCKQKDLRWKGIEPLASAVTRQTPAKESLGSAYVTITPPAFVTLKFVLVLVDIPIS